MASTSNSASAASSSSIAAGLYSKPYAGFNWEEWKTGWIFHCTGSSN
jgi:hypothetical protein